MKRLSLFLLTALTASWPALASDAPKASACGECCGENDCAGVIAAYVKVSNALAADSLKDAQAAAANLACCLKCDEHAEVSAKVEAMATAESLADARAAFKAISAAVIPLVEKSGSHFVMTCPMANADWIQTSEAVANPYYGSQMLHCGSIKKTVKNES